MLNGDEETMIPVLGAKVWPHSAALYQWAPRTCRVRLRRAGNPPALVFCGGVYVPWVALLGAMTQGDRHLSLRRLCSVRSRVTSAESVAGGNTGEVGLNTCSAVLAMCLGHTSSLCLCVLGDGDSSQLTEE